MKGEAEEPTGNLLAPVMLVFESGNPGESVCDYDIFITWWFVALPSQLHPIKWPAKPWAQRKMDRTKSVGNREGGIGQR